MFFQCVEFAIEIERYADFVGSRRDAVELCGIIYNIFRLGVLRYFQLKIFQFAIQAV